MPYFDDLRDLLNDTLLWADLRHEQGGDVQGLLKRLRKDLKRARKELRKTAPGVAVGQYEPNALERIRALRPDGPRRLWPRLNTTGLEDKLKGAWLGRAIGCTLGAPVENWSIGEMERLASRCGTAFPPTDYWADHPRPDDVRYAKSRVAEYLKGGMSCVPVDDDVTYTLLGLLILEEFGPGYTTDDVGQAWLKYLPVACTAEDVALRNLKKGVPAAKAGAKDNPFQEWIGADIR
ncbi:MAG: ADP-ribosylglycohydrolase family protein, partial [Candidatus Hydrogenedentes bacterium]|nr:ADP-ribosylglycohydrolase family protein [Candidatus Hydrogenedentota bacterium]